MGDSGQIRLELCYIRALCTSTPTETQGGTAGRGTTFSGFGMRIANREKKKNHEPMSASIEMAQEIVHT